MGSTTVSSIKVGENPTDLGELEYKVMKTVWESEAVTAERSGSCSAPAALKESTIRTGLSSRVMPRVGGGEG